MSVTSSLLFGEKNPFAPIASAFGPAVFEKPLSGAATPVEIPRGEVFSAIATDPNVSSQWFLRSIRQDALKDQYTGKGVSTGVYDEAIQATHADLAGSYDASKELVVGAQRLSGIGAGSHGTAVAGLITANAGNGIGGVGVSSEAMVTGINIFGNAGGANMIGAIRHMKTFDTTNNSWGWTNNFVDGTNTGFGAAFQSALQGAADLGRGGLGTIVVNASGNSWSTRTDSNASAFNQSRHTVTVGAIGQDGDVAGYATRGASLLVSASSNGGGAGIFTTDVVGSGGYAAGDYTSGFGGTSAATPIVTGVVNLMLEASGKSLGWRDVQDILAITADHTGPSSLTGTVAGRMAFGWTINGADNVNGGGMHYSNDVGYGLVDAFEAVRFAEIWNRFGPAETSANEQATQVTGTVNLAIRDNATTSFTVAVARTLEIEHVDLTLTMSHANINQLRVELVSPEGTRSIVLSPLGGAISSGTNWTWTFGSDALRGELSNGLWTVRITDTAAGSTGSVQSYRLAVYGDAPSVDDAYHYTNEFAKMAALDAGRRVLRDTDGGRDWINMAGMTAAVTANLQAGGTVSMAGAAMFTIAAGSVIENIVTGDGNDTVTGNDAANTLVGMRGNDTLLGGAGNDTLEGGEGNDWLDGGAGADLLNGGAGTDTADYSNSNALVFIDFSRATQKSGHAASDALVSIELVIGSRFNDTLRGADGNDTLEGGLGNDSLSGGNGNDWLSGDDGMDLIFGGAGNDQLLGGAGNDQLFGQAGDDSLTGGAGNDRMAGDAGRDTLLGGDGDDTLLGEAGQDVLTGGAGRDSFVFSTALGSDNVDRITDFLSGVDKIMLDDAIFLAFRGQTIVSTPAFSLSATALDAFDRIVYDRNTGNLFYDPNGSGAGGQTLFAQLNAGTALSVSDILIF